MTTLNRLIKLPFRFRLWRPSHLRLIGADMFGRASGQPHSHLAHLTATVDWLCRAQDQRDGLRDAGGVSAGWSFEDGWLPGYPETSGYTVETFLAAARVLERADLVDRAHRILDWECALQCPDGAFPGHFGESGSKPVIFNTGQIMHGMIAGYHELGRQECLEAAVRAAHWMLDKQDDDGCWRRSVHNDIPHTYNTRAAWALMRTGLLAGEKRFIDGAIRNMDWACGQATACGWFQENAFRSVEAPFTHTIAYAMRGLLEGGILADEPRFIDAAARAGKALLLAQRADGWIAGEFENDWRPTGRYACLTGIAQIGLNWQRLQHIGVPGDWQLGIDRAIEFLERHHHIPGDGSPRDGGLAGSYPIWGRYSRFEYPNWAAKFFADLLVMAISDEVVPPESTHTGRREEVATCA
jgi:hypothetical protein